MLNTSPGSSDPCDSLRQMIIAQRGQLEVAFQRIVALETEVLKLDRMQKERTEYWQNAKQRITELEKERDKWHSDACTQMDLRVAARERAGRKREAIGRSKAINR